MAGDEKATVGGLQTAVACSPLKVPITLQRLVKFRDNGTATLLVDADKELVRDLGIWSGEDVVVEVCCC